MHTWGKYSKQTNYTAALQLPPEDGTSYGNHKMQPVLLQAECVSHEADVGKHKDTCVTRNDCPCHFVVFLQSMP